MPELQVIFDPVQEIAAVVNLDDRVGWGPTMVGPSAKDLLTAFVDGLPFDISEVPSVMARDFFESWFRTVMGDALDDAEPGAESTMVDAPSASVGGDSLAQREAVHTPDGPPPPQPADTDPEADQGTQDPVAPAVDTTLPAGYDPGVPAGGQTIPCPFCAASGKNPAGPVDGNDNCPMCKGTKEVML